MKKPFSSGLVGSVSAAGTAQVAATPVLRSSVSWWEQELVVVEIANLQWSEKRSQEGEEMRPQSLRCPWGGLGRLTKARALILWSRLKHLPQNWLQWPRGQQHWLPEIHIIWSPSFWGNISLKSELSWSSARERPGVHSSSEVHFREEEGPFSLKIREGATATQLLHPTPNPSGYYKAPSWNSTRGELKGCHPWREGGSRIEMN